MIQAAAADALSAMTGLSYGIDVTQWREWLAGTPKNEAAWIAQVQSAHASLLEKRTRQESAIVDRLRALTEVQYQAASNPEKERLMTEFLSDPLPRMRLTGIDLYSRAFSSRQYQPPVGKERIPELLGDSDKQVRLAAARAVHLQNLVNSPGPILTQLVQEPDADVRAELVADLSSVQGGDVQPMLGGTAE